MLPRLFTFIVGLYLQKDLHVCLSHGSGEHRFRPLMHHQYVRSSWTLTMAVHAAGLQTKHVLQAAVNSSVPIWSRSPVVFRVHNILMNVSASHILRHISGCWLCGVVSWKHTLRARFMRPTWGNLGPVGPRWAPCRPHEPCYLVKLGALYNMLAG